MSPALPPSPPFPALPPHPTSATIESSTVIRMVPRSSVLDWSSYRRGPPNVACAAHIVVLFSRLFLAGERGRTGRDEIAIELARSRDALDEPCRGLQPAEITRLADALRQGRHRLRSDVADDEPLPGAVPRRPQRRAQPL